MASSQMRSSTRRFPVSSNDITLWQSTISHLYMVEDKTLAQVMSAMKSVYGVNATERQYKRKITEWHLDKNVKDSEVRYIIQVQSSRARLGKETTFRVRGRAVPSSKIERFRQRKGLRTNADMLPDYQTPTSSQDIRYLTPDPEESISDSLDSVNCHRATPVFDEKRAADLVKGLLNEGATNETWNQPATILHPPESSIELAPPEISIELAPPVHPLGLAVGSTQPRYPEVNMDIASPSHHWTARPSKISTDSTSSGHVPAAIKADQASKYDSLVSERLNQANIARSAPQTGIDLQSPYRETSEYLASHAINTAGRMREEAKIQADKLALAQHQPHLASIDDPVTISPKNAFLDYEQREEDTGMSLFLQKPHSKLPSVQAMLDPDLFEAGNLPSSRSDGVPTSEGQHRWDKIKALDDMACNAHCPSFDVLCPKCLEAFCAFSREGGKLISWARNIANPPSNLPSGK